MKNAATIVIVCISLFILLSQTVKASEQNVKSSVVAVTVYSDRALITRTAKLFLRAGTQTLTFDGLPDALIDESVKVIGESEAEAKIVDVKVEQQFLDTIPETRANELAQRLADLRGRKNAIDIKRMVVMSQMSTVDSIRTNYARSLSGSNPGQKAMTTEWDKLLDFVGNKKTEYNTRIEDYQRQTDLLVRQISTAEKELRDINSGIRMSVKVLTVIVAMPKTDSLSLDVSYIIPEAHWTPMYEARISGTDSVLQLVYTGQVSQTTGEDWKDIDLVLSTAQPALGNIPPQLEPWSVDFQPTYTPVSGYSNIPRIRPSSHQTSLRANSVNGKVVDALTTEPIVGANVILEGTALGASTDVNGQFVIYNVPTGVYTAKVSYIGYEQPSITGIQVTGQRGATETFYLSPSTVQVQAVTIQAERPMVQRNATNAVNLVQMQRSGVSVQSILTSAVFRIASKQSIPTDGQMHKVGIAIEELPVSFNYQSSPKIVPATYLQARGKNSTDFPFLGGPVNVFYDNGFIATSQLRTIVPNDTFAVSCGIDEGVRVERKLVRKFTEEVGTFTKNVRVTFEYETTVNNLRKRGVTLILHDQVPISRNEDVTVKVLEPKEDEMKPGQDGILTWQLKLAPEVKRVVNVKFYVEYPRDRRIFGLE